MDKFAYDAITQARRWEDAQGLLLFALTQYSARLCPTGLIGSYSQRLEDMCREMGVKSKHASWVDLFEFAARWINSNQSDYGVQKRLQHYADTGERLWAYSLDPKDSYANPSYRKMDCCIYGDCYLLGKSTDEPCWGKVSWATYDEQTIHACKGHELVYDGGQYISECDPIFGARPSVLAM